MPINFEDIELFTGFTHSEIRLIATCTTIRHYPKNYMLISEGEHGDTLYMILSGKVRVYVSNEEGREVTLCLQGPGEYFGELALLDRSPRSASVVTLEACEMAVLARTDFESCLLQNPRMSLQIGRSLAKRVRMLTERVRNLALLNVYWRVVQILDELAIAQPNGHRLIQPKLSHQHIASLVGASREMVARVMRELHEEHYIESSSTSITIIRPLPKAN